MLVLMRRPGEEIHIGDNVAITVLVVSGNRVKLGITGPADVRILRGELSAKIAAADLDAPSPLPATVVVEATVAPVVATKAVTAAAARTGTRRSSGVSLERRKRSPLGATAPLASALDRRSAVAQLAVR